jgi:CubicO group peptidase (beta-lactamase class C family)
MPDSARGRDGTLAGPMTEFRQIVATELERFEVPGCAVAVVAGGEVLLCEGFGHRDVARGLPVTPHTLFPIASSTKTFTAALCAVLVDQGKLAWDRPIRDYAPEFALRDPVASEQVTIFDLLCHRSGLPRHDLLWYAAGNTIDREALVRSLRHLAPSRGFRQTWQYNNLLYTTAGWLAGMLSGAGSYEAAVRRLLLDPLGMTRTNFSVDETGNDADAAVPYVSPSPGEPVAPAPYARLDAIGPAGSINSCAADLVPWLLTLLGHGVDGRAPLLSDSVRSMLPVPAAALPAGSQLAVGTPVGYGLGVIIEDYRGHRLVHHGGNIDGFSSQVSTIPDRDIGVAVLCNRDGTMLRDTLPLLIFERLLGLPPTEPPLGEELHAKERAVHTGRAQHRQHTAAPGNGLAAVRPLGDYAGTYRDDGYGDLVIGDDGDGLTGSYGALSGPLEHRHLEVFNLVLDLGGIVTPVPVQFFHDLDGEVSAAEVLLEQAVAPIRFARVPDTSHLTGELLDRLAGEYRMGPLVATVARRGETELVARIAEGGFAPLTPVRGLVFRFAGTGRVEFTRDGRMITPAGEFQRDEG